MGKNMQRLGNVLADRMNRTAQANSTLPLELGTINGDGSLKTDSLTGNISPADYMVDIRLTAASYETSKITLDGEEHNHKLPSAFRQLQAGDRVLVAWVGNEPVIVAILVSGNATTA